MKVTDGVGVAVAVGAGVSVGVGAIVGVLVAIGVELITVNWVSVLVSMQPESKRPIVIVTNQSSLTPIQLGLHRPLVNLPQRRFINQISE